MQQEPDRITPSTPTSKSLTVEKAKSIVDRAMSSTKSSHGEDGTIMPQNYIPQWGGAREEISGVLEAVEVPIMTNKNLFAIDSNGHRLVVHQRVLVADGQNFRHTASYMMTLIAASDYSGDLWSIEHAGDRRGFTGIILYHALSNGQFVKVNRLENGQSVEQLYVSKYSDEHIELLRIEIDRIMCGTRIFQPLFATKGIDDVNEIGEVVVIGSSGNGTGSGGGPGGPGKDDKSGNETNEDDQQCPDGGGGGGGGWTPPALPQGPPPMTSQKAVYAINKLLMEGKVRVNDVIPNGITTSEISDFRIKIYGIEVYIHHFGLGFGGGNHENNYATSYIEEVGARTTRYGNGLMFTIYNGSFTPGVGSFTVAIEDATYFKEAFQNAPKPPKQ